MRRSRAGVHSRIVRPQLTHRLWLVVVYLVVVLVMFALSGHIGSGTSPSVSGWSD